MKPQASPVYFYRTCEVPALGAAQAARTRAVPLCHFVTFPPPRGGIFPNPLPALPFLVRRKGSKRLFRGFPPKDPQGERSGRVPLAPTAGILGGNNRRIESQQVRSRYQKNTVLYKGSYVIVQLSCKLFRLFRARTVQNPRSVTSPYFALTGREGFVA